MHSNEAEQHLSMPTLRIHLHASQCHSPNSLIHTLRLSLHFPFLLFLSLSFPFLFSLSFPFCLHISPPFLALSLPFLFRLISPFSVSHLARLLFLSLCSRFSSPPLAFHFYFFPRTLSPPWLPVVLPPPPPLLLLLLCPVMSISRASGDHSRQ